MLKEKKLPAVEIREVDSIRKSGGHGMARKRPFSEVFREHMVKSGFDEFDPVLFLGEVAADPLQDIELRYRCAKEVAPYLHAKLKNLDIKAEVGVETWIKNRVLQLANTDNTLPG